jgi:hypothetical protein
MTQMCNICTYRSLDSLQVKNLAETVGWSTLNVTQQVCGSVLIVFYRPVHNSYTCASNSPNFSLQNITG